jgi:uncharacterized DUF497 family protein
VEFEWDEEKRLSNIRNHGIDFVRACQIFEEHIVEYEDKRYDYQEQRFVAIGETGGKIITVVHTYRNQTIRLISARKATKNETKIYYESFPGRS